MTNEPRTIDITQVKNLDVTANPAAIGLTTLGMITLILSLMNAGLFGLNSMVLAWRSCAGVSARLLQGSWSGRRTTRSGWPHS